MENKLNKKVLFTLRVLEKWRYNTSRHRTDISPREREKQKSSEYNLSKALQEVIEEDALTHEK